MACFDLGGAVNSAADWVCNAPFVRGIVNNPIFTALLITALVVIVIMAQSKTRCSARSILYIFFMITAVIFVHHYAVLQTINENVATNGVRTVFSSIQESRGMPGQVPVVPMGVCMPVIGSGEPIGMPYSREDNVAAPDQATLLQIHDVVVPTPMK